MDSAIAPPCHCGGAAVVRVSKRVHSLGRSFWGCPLQVPCKKDGAFLGWVSESQISSALRAPPVSFLETAASAQTVATVTAVEVGQPAASRDRSRSQDRQKIEVLAAEAASDTAETRAPILQARFDSGIANHTVVRLPRVSCEPFTLYTKAGCKAHDKIFLDGVEKDVRLADIEVFLWQRDTPPQNVASSAILYQLSVPRDVTNGRTIRNRGEWLGATHFSKASVIFGETRMVKDWKAGIDEAMWMKRAVAFSYQHRLRSCPFWQSILKGVCRPKGTMTPLDDLLPFIVKAKLIERTTSQAAENELGFAIGACPGVTCVQDRSRWSSASFDGVHLYHFLGPRVEAVGPLAN